MKKNYILIVIFLILILVYGLFYVANLRLEGRISNLRNEFNVAQTDNEALKNSLLYYESPARVESIAKSKYKMIVPKDFYITSIKDEE